MPLMREKKTLFIENKARALGKSNALVLHMCKIYSFINIQYKAGMLAQNAYKYNGRRNNN